MKDTKVNLLTYLWEFVNQSKLYYIFYLLLIPIVPLIQNFILPLIIGNFYDSIKNKAKSIRLLLQFITFLAIMYFLHILINFMAWRVIPSFSEYCILRIYEYIYSNTFCNYENINVNEIIMKISKMPTVLHDSLKMFKEETCRVFFGVLFGFIYFYKLGPKYLYTYTILVLLLLIVQYFNINTIIQLNKEKENIADHTYGKLGDSLYNIISVQSFQNIQKENSILKEILNQYSNIYYESLMKSLTFDVLNKILNYVLCIILGYFLIKDYYSNKLSNKILFQASQIIILIGYLLDLTGVVGRSICDRFGEIYDINDFFNKEVPFDKQCRSGEDTFINGNIEFKQVYHKYDLSGVYVLENVSLSIKQGEKIALVGESGSGKSTLIKLLMKHQHLIMGNIIIGNVSVKNLSAEEIAKNIMYIPQNPKLFNRSLYDNIVYGLDKPPSKQQILDILNNMDMDIISNDFKDKMDELCGHDGSSLSGGQRQIVWLLRSLYRVKPIIILDEPTSALDPENKKIVMNAIKKVGVGKTIIIISHDDIDGEFKKVHFKDGQIVESNYSMYF